MDGTVHGWNPEAEELFGWTREEALGRDIRELTPAPGMLEEAEEVMASLRDKEPWSGVFELQRKDGSTFPGHVTDAPLEDEDGQLVGIIGITRDLTEVERARARLEQAERIAGLGSWRINLATGDLWISDGFQGVTGLPAEDDLNPELFFEHVHPEDRDRVRRNFEGLEQESGIMEDEFRLRKPDGQTIKLASRFNVHVTPEGQTTVTGISQDVTAQRKLESTLLEERRRLEEAQALASIGSWEWDLGQDRLTWSDEMYRLLGYDVGDPEHPSTEDFYERVHEADRESLQEQVARLLSWPNPDPLDEVFRIVRPEGTVLWVHAKGRTQSRDGAPVRALGTVQDITRRRKMEQRLLAHQELIDEVQRMAGAGDWEWRPEEDKMYWSKNQYRLLGFEPDELSPPRVQDYLDRVHPEERDYVEDHLKEALRASSGDAQRLEHRIHSPGEPERWVEIRFSTETDEQPRMYGKTLDITEHKKLELNQDDQLRRLETRNQQLERISMATSHPLREIVREIHIRAQRAQQNLETHLDEASSQDLATIQEASKQLRSVLEDFQEYVTLATREPHAEPTALGPVLDTVLDRLSSQIQETNAEVTHEDLPTVDMDPGSLETILHRLIHNAIVYSGGKPPRIHVAGQAENDMWLISVSDEGIGIDPDYHERIFQPFTRLHTRDEIPGGGLGLAISRWLIEDAGGTIWCTSKPGEGATFYCTLPNPDPSTPEPHRESSL